jgi:hypothetical protein
MMTYEEFQAWYDRHKGNIMLGACFVLVFLSGFGAGRFDKYRASKDKAPANYSKPVEKQQKAAVEIKTKAEGEGVVAGVTIASSSPAAPQECKIKGNISSGGKKIYHIPGGASYKTTKPEQCFNTEEEAAAAGFVKSGR